MRRKPRILLDCDGVMADYTSAVLEFIHQQTGNRHTSDEVTDWDVFKCLGYEHLEPTLIKEINEQDWCLNLPVYRGVREALSELRKVAHVVCVTAPYKAVCWPGQRLQWLYELGFTRRTIVQTHGKDIIPGDVFVDDNVNNVHEWYAEHANGAPIIWQHPYNSSTTLKPGVALFNDWNVLVKLVEDMASTEITWS